MKISLMLFCFLLSACHVADCDKIPTSFNSYSEAIEIVENYRFPFKDKIVINKSTWIRKAQYFSCNSGTGFFLLKTDTQCYIHQDLPIEIWYEFKKASSFGQFYSQNIKSRYQCRLE